MTKIDTINNYKSQNCILPATKDSSDVGNNLFFNPSLESKVKAIFFGEPIVTALKDDLSSPTIKLKIKSQLHDIITNDNGTPDYLAINIYYDTLRSWYTPNKLKTSDGKILEVAKLKTKGIYLSYKELAKAHGCSTETIRKKLVKLEKLGLIQRSYRHKETVTTKSYNQLIVYVWKQTPYFYSKHGIEQSDITELKPQTNHQYITEKYNIDYHSKIEQIKAVGGRGGIHKDVDTKELIEPFPKEKDRSYKSNFSKFNSNSNSNSNSDGTDQSKNSEVIKNTKIIQNGFLGSGRSLNEMLECLTEEICEQVRAECGRDFTDRAIKQITKAVSRSKKGAKAVFYHINGLIAYLSKLLKFEKRDPVKVSSINYYITGNLTEEEKIIQKQEKYLTELEYSLQVSPEWHLKKKLAAVLERSKAYKLLTSYKSIDVREGEAKIYLNNHVELTQTEYDLILSQIQATHELLGEGGQNNQIDRVSIEMPDRLPSSKASKPETGLAARVGVWGTIRTIFANYFGDKGDGLDSSWLSRLEATFDETTKSLRLKAPSEFYKDYVSQHFLPELTSATSQSGFKLISIEC